ncbi:MAG: hypothetical protein HeimC2_23930 [Candidatus Heimdallarchaeota archaeon LC_2]|nr:MAG: hypothetical protein HeimC2_23930 [Candidatus Heimdallarchaeota archaeon LC_2]
MAVSLFLSTLIPILIFVPFGILIKNGTFNISKLYSSFIIGGIGWSVYSILAFIPYYYIFTESSEESYMQTIAENKTLLFFMLIFLSIVSEVVRFEFYKSPIFPEKSIKYTIVFGAGWGVAEFLGRFIFFFDSDMDQYLPSISLLLFFVMISNAGLTTILIRSSENTKYVMFAAFVKFFVEIAFFGAFGNDLGFEDRYSRLGFFFLIQIIMFYLTMKTRKIIESE